MKKRSTTPSAPPAAEDVDLLQTPQPQQQAKIDIATTESATPRRGRPLKVEDPNLVDSLNDLAHILGVTRRCLYKWIKRFKDDPDPPPPKRGDRYDVKAWKAWVARHELGNQTDSTQGEEDSKAFWDRRCAQLKFERETFAFEVEKQKHIPIEEITAGIGQMLAGFRTALNMLPGSAARWLIGLKDFHAIKHKLQSEVDAVLQALGRRRYLEELAPAVVDKMFSEEAPDFRETLARSCEAVFRELGREALSDLLQREIESAETSAAAAAPEEKAGAASAEAAPGIPLQPSTKSRAQTRPRK